MVAAVLFRKEKRNKSVMRYGDSVDQQLSGRSIIHRQFTCYEKKRADRNIWAAIYVGKLPQGAASVDFEYIFVVSLCLD